MLKAVIAVLVRRINNFVFTLQLSTSNILSDSWYIRQQHKKLLPQAIVKEQMVSQKVVITYTQSGFLLKQCHMFRPVGELTKLANSTLL
jgi:hypothetical protein